MVSISVLQHGLWGPTGHNLGARLEHGGQTFNTRPSIGSRILLNPRYRNALELLYIAIVTVETAMVCTKVHISKLSNKKKDIANPHSNSHESISRMKPRILLSLPDQHYAWMG